MLKVNYSLINKVIVIWRKPNNTYYYRLINHNYDYKVGFINNYDHEIVLIIDIFKKFFYKEKFSKMVLKKFISFLQNKLEKM